MEPTNNNPLPFLPPPLGEPERVAPKASTVEPVNLPEPRYIPDAHHQLPGNSAREVSKIASTSFRSLAPLQQMSEAELLHVVFDQRTLLNWEEYLAEEKEKATNLVNAWLVMLDAVVEGRFTRSPEDLKSLLSELHATYFAHAPKYFWEYIEERNSPGQFRFEAKTEIKINPSIQKRDDIHYHPDLLTHHIHKMQEYSALEGLPNLPEFCLKHKAEGHKDIAYLAVPGNFALKLCSHKELSEEELKTVFTEICQYYQEYPDLPEYLQKLQELSPPLYAQVHHWLTIADLNILQVTTHYEDVAGRLQMAVNDFMHKRNSPMRHFIYFNKLPQSHIEPLLTHCLTSAVSGIFNPTTESEFNRHIATSALDLLSLRPFCDGNTRIACLLLQGFRLTCGFSPLMLESRYIFSAGENYVEQMITTASKCHPIASFTPSPEQLETIRPLAEKLRQLKTD